MSTALIAGLVAFGFSLLQETLYEAEGTVVFAASTGWADVAGDLGIPLDMEQHADTQARLVDSPEVAQRAAEVLSDGTSPEQIQAAVSAAPTIGSTGIRVRAVMSTGEAAVAVVNAVVRAYEDAVSDEVQASRERVTALLAASSAAVEERILELDDQVEADPMNSVLDARRTAAVDQLAALDTRIEQLSTAAMLYGSGIGRYVPPVAPSAPFQPTPVRDAAIVAALGAVGAGVWAWFRPRNEPTSESTDEPS